MIVEIVYTVPGTVNYRHLRQGDVTELEDAVASSLISDGFAVEVTRQTPREAAETAVAAPKGRRPIKS